METISAGWRSTSPPASARRRTPASVLVSSTVKDLLAGTDIVFEDRGEHELKGVPGAWRLFGVGLR